MRKTLAKNEGLRKRFRAIFVRTGKKTNYLGYSEDTILLKDVMDVESNTKVTDHIWFTYSKAFEKVDLKEGVIVEFDARVKEYTKGYVNKTLGVNKQRRDYRLSHPTKISVI